MKIVCVSGGFDPIHVGHLRMFEEARKLGDFLVVIVNNDEWLWRKKKRIFMPLFDRLEIIRSIRYVGMAYPQFAMNDDVCSELTIIKPHIFANGGDRKEYNIPEYDFCIKNKIKLIFNVGGGKLKSSSELLENYEKTLG